MGEAKRRKKLDPNYGKSNPLKDACRMIDDFLSKNPQMDEDSHFLLFTNKERGCTEKEIEILQKEIPLRYEGKCFMFGILPQKYAHLPAEEALDYFVPISVGMSEMLS